MFPAAVGVCQRSLTSQCAGTRSARASLNMARVGDASGCSRTTPARSGCAAADFDGEVGAEILPDKDDCIAGNVPGSSQVADRRIGVFAPARFTGARKVALPIAAIVKGKNVHPGGVQPRKNVDRVAKVAVGAVEINRGSVSLRRRGNPPAAKLRVAGRVGGKPDGIEGQIHAGRRARHGRGGVVQQLPVSLPEEDAQGAPCAEHRAREGHRPGAQQPLCGNSWRCGSAPAVGALTGRSRCRGRAVFSVRLGFTHLHLHTGGATGLCYSGSPVTIGRSPKGEAGFASRKIHLI